MWLKEMQIGVEDIELLFEEVGLNTLHILYKTFYSVW
jgi:hypothetical protein